MPTTTRATPPSHDRQAGEASSASAADPFSGLDPALHAATLNSVTEEETLAPEDSDRLSTFAQHVLGGQSRDEAASLLAFSAAGEDDALFQQSAHRSFTELLSAEGGAHHGSSHDLDQDDLDGEHDQANRHPMDGQHPGQDATTLDALKAAHDDLGEAPPPPDRGGRRGKRRREDEVHENGQGLDPARMKKDSHKEVERRRRENINDGINDIAKHVPGGIEKMGKGVFLRRAAEYLAECKVDALRYEDERNRREAEKVEFQTELAHLQSRLRDEHDRSIRYETSWREAEDRAASSQFELERLRGELEDLKKQYGV